MVENIYGSDPPLGFLLARASRAIALRLERRFQEAGFDITIEHWVILRTLCEEPVSSQRTFTRLLGRDKTAVTRLICGMESNGWVRRGTDPKDKRNKVIEITRKGLELREEVEPILEKTNKEVEDQLDPSSLQCCKGVLEDLYSILKEEEGYTKI